MTKNYIKSKTIAVYPETYNKLKETADKNGQIITFLASKFIDKGLAELESNGGKDSKKEN